MVNKQEQNKLDKLRLDLIDYLGNLEEADKIALERASEIMIKSCNHLHIGLDAFMLMYLNHLERLGLLIEYNAKVVDINHVMTYKTGSGQYEVERPASKLSDYVLTDSEIAYLVNLKLLKPEVLVDKIKSLDRDTSVWEVSNYFTEDAIRIFSLYKRDSGLEYEKIWGLYEELHEAYPSSFKSNNKIYNGKPTDKDHMMELARMYHEATGGNKELHESILKYVGENASKFSNGLKKFISNKQWEGNLPKKSTRKNKLIL